MSGGTGTICSAVRDRYLEVVVAGPDPRRPGQAGKAVADAATLRHLDDCAACDRWVGRLRQLDQGLSVLPVMEPPGKRPSAALPAKPVPAWVDPKAVMAGLRQLGWGDSAPAFRHPVQVGRPAPPVGMPPLSIPGAADDFAGATGMPTASDAVSAVAPSHAGSGSASGGAAGSPTVAPSKPSWFDRARATFAGLAIWRPEWRPVLRTWGPSMAAACVLIGVWSSLAAVGLRTLLNSDGSNRPVAAGGPDGNPDPRGRVDLAGVRDRIDGPDVGGRAGHAGDVRGAGPRSTAPDSTPVVAVAELSSPVVLDLRPAYFVRSPGGDDLRRELLAESPYDGSEGVGPETDPTGEASNRGAGSFDVFGAWLGRDAGWYADAAGQYFRRVRKGLPVEDPFTPSAAGSEPSVAGTPGMRDPDRPAGDPADRKLQRSPRDGPGITSRMAESWAAVWLPGDRTAMAGTATASKAADAATASKNGESPVSARAAGRVVVSAGGSLVLRGLQTVQTLQTVIVRPLEQPLPPGQVPVITLGSLPPDAGNRPGPGPGLDPEDDPFPPVPGAVPSSPIAPAAPDEP